MTCADSYNNVSLRYCYQGLRQFPLASILCGARHFLDKDHIIQWNSSIKIFQKFNTRDFG